MKIRHIPYILILLSFFSVSLFAGEFRNVGSSGANFLQIPVEASGAAMANSNVASATGVMGLYWNPAAISLSEGTEIMLSGADWILDTKITYFGITHNFGTNTGTIGFAVTALTMGEMEITTEYEPNGTGEYFDAGDICAGLSYAKAFTDRFNFGGSIKWVYEYIWEANTSVIAFDFGSVYRTDFHNLRIGMNISNFGGSMKMFGTAIDDKIEAAQGVDENNPQSERLSEEYSIPQLFNVGVALDPYVSDEHRLTISAMANDPNDNDTRLSFGMEYGFKETFFLRGGFKSGYDEQTFSAGLGFNFHVGGRQSTIDYAYSAFGVLGDINHLTYKIKM